ncbi:PTS ascorbate transporter subunit IIB [Suicoccus acidiformans]|uniref:PTS ascorbate transporter subunit IIB n=1 Tax=Suicoccus acidiformans TaxID=2036206 RepID=A0A347WIG4_9LACT|nr:PTS sugar transporter subunit IIB [Suicoccus acidiformans]AXY24871.1 PTS ascorbate transporter subunit IIB [Suicoccus acidiformans]
MRVLVSCANGSGTSLMMMKSAEKAIKKLNIPITNIHHTSISEGKSTAKNYDVVLTPVNFVNMFDSAKDKGVTVLGIKNVMSAKEIEEAIAGTDLVDRFGK